VKKQGKFLLIPALLVLMVSLTVFMVMPALGAAITLETQVLDTNGATTTSTTVGGVQYVAATTTASDTVKVWVVDDSLAGTSTAVTVQNATTGVTITGGISATRASTGTTTVPYIKSFNVGTTTSTSTPSIAGSNGDTIRVVYDVVVKDLKVDASAPTIASLSPSTATLTQAQTVQFTGSITDTASGIEGTSSAPTTGAIVITVDSVDRTNLATWTAITNGYSFSVTLFLSEAAHTWKVTSKDRVANSATSDSSSATAGQQDHSLTIDKTAPVIMRVTTGKGYNSTTKKVVADNTSLMLEFVKSGTTDPDVAGNHDYLDGGSLDVSDFHVNGVVPTGLTFPNVKAADAGDSIETRNRVFLTTATIGSSAKPLVRVIGLIKDLAGNSQTTGEKTALDGIAPILTVTTSGTAGSGARTVTSDATGEKTTITITADEALTASPTVSITTLTGTSTSPYVEVLAVSTLSATPTAGATNTWTVTRAITEGPGSGSRLMNVAVTGTGSGGSNSGSAGQGIPSGGTIAVVGTTVNLSTATLFEFDASIATPTITLNPAVSGASTTTESTAPFLRVDFDSEGTEFTIADNDSNSSTDSVKISETATVEVDSHNGVTLTKAELDGVDVTANVGSVDSNSFLISTTGLTLGTHTLKINGTDGVGNKLASDHSYTFTVKARSAHSISLVPGWNQISFPGDPASTAINTVLAGNTAISEVWTYAPGDSNGPWLFATRNATSGLLEGTLANINGSQAYWIKTTTFNAVSSILSERSFTVAPPTISIIAGWNLVPVANLQLLAVGTQIDPDLYFASITWTVIYHFDTSTNSWTKITPSEGGDPKIKVGEGWWVFATKAGDLVP